MADRGRSVTDIARELGCAKVTAEYWAMVSQQGDIDRWQTQPIGRPGKIDERYLDRLQEILNHSPRHYDYPFTRWTIDWLRMHLAHELGIVISNRHFKRVLKELGLSTRHQMVSRSKKNRVAIVDLVADSVDS